MTIRAGQKQKSFCHGQKVETNESLSYSKIISKHPNRGVREIYDGVCDAVKELDTMQCLKFDSPIDVEVRYQRSDRAANSNTIGIDGEFFAQTDAYTRCGKLKNAEDIIMRLQYEDKLW